MGDKFNYLCVNGGELGLPIRFDNVPPHVAVPEATPPIYHPAAVPLLKINKWWWQVKDWFLDTDLSFTNSAGTTYTMSSGVLSNENASVVRELNLISGSNFSVGNAHDFSASLGDGFGQISAPREFPLPVNSSGVYYPGIFVNAAIAALGEGVTLQSQDNTGAPFELNANLDGILVPLYRAVTAGGSYSVSKFNLTINSFWPY